MPTASNKQVNVNENTNYFPPQGTDLLTEFEQNNKSYQLFKTKGLDKDAVGVDNEGKPISTIGKILNGDNGLFRATRIFLNNVDPAKGPVQRRVTRLERRKDLDPNTHKLEEHLVVHLEWVAKDFLGNEIKAYDIKEGMYNEPVVTATIVNGKRVTRYANWKAIYDIPFNAQTVNDALDNQINTPELINYFVRVSQTVRDGSFSLEQFRDSTFEECRDISAKGKGLNR